MAFFSSSTRQVPEAAAVPQHVAVIMDGNGRWAKKRFLPRVAGHVKGVELVREMVRACLERGIKYLTLFAFSSENWRRPQDEVSLLMQLFVKALEQEVESLDRNGVRLRVIGDLSRFDPRLQQLIRDAEARTAGRTGGEERISNFLLWQLAYTELYFTETLWPAFDTAEFDKAIASYQQRERRFGRTSEQLTGSGNA